MKLEDLRKKLYSRDDDLDKRERSWDFFNPAAKPSEKDQPNAPDSSFNFDKLDEMDAKKDHWQIEQQVNQKFSDKNRVTKYGLIGAGGLIVTIFLILGLVKYQESAFSEEKVIVEVNGPEEISSGQEIVYEVNLKNQNRADLISAVLKLNYSNEMIVADQPGLIKEGLNNAKFELGKLGSGESKKLQFNIKTFGQREKQVYFNAALSYKPENFNSQFEKNAQFSGIIKSSLLGIDLMSITKEAASGEQVEMQLIVKNDSAEDFDDIEVKMEYPEGFGFANADPGVSESNNRWSFGAIESGAQMKIVITGMLEGPPDSVKMFSAQIGKARSDGDFLKYNQDEDSIKLIAPRILVSQTINGKDSYFANAEDSIEYEIKFKNNSGFPLRDLILTEEIISPVLDKSKVVVTNGFYDSEKNIIIWKASNVPLLKTLEHNQEGSVKFRIGIMDKFPMEGENDKNFIVSSQASIGSLDVDSPLGQNKMIFSPKIETKVNSKLVLNVVGNYNDGEIPNQGPVPMVVGQETTFTLRLNVLNTSNDLQNVVLSTSLPAGIAWKNKTVPESISSLDYNERTNEIKWMLGTLPAGTGFIFPVKNLAFQISAVPSANQVSRHLTLLNPIKVTALDSFTNQQVEYSFKQFLSTELSDVRSTDGVVKSE